VLAQLARHGPGEGELARHSPGEGGLARRSLDEGGAGRRRRSEGGAITILYSVAFRSDAGDLLEETLVPIAVSCSGRRWRHNRAALRAQVKRAVTDLARDLDLVLDGVASARLAAIAGAHSHNASAHEARRRAISGRLASTAGMLVQPGLFARAALRTAMMPAAPWLDEAPIEDGAGRQIVWQARIEAVICGSLT